jgi:hypothetical protein
MNPYLFIVACPHSGTTVLRRIVDAHPRIAITPETHWISEVVRQGRGIDVAGRLSPGLREVLEAHPTFAGLGIGRDEVERLTRGRPSYAAFVAALFDAYGAARGKSIVGDSTPAYLQEIGLLHDLFPHARFVHLVRDGRDVCLSALESEAGAAQSTVTTVALWWRGRVLEGRATGARLGPELYVELRYEALVADPQRECRRLCDFLGVAFDRAMLPERRRRFERGQRNWTTEMAREQVEEFEAAAGDALEAFGYPRAFGVTAPT